MSNVHEHVDTTVKVETGKIQPTFTVENWFSCYKIDLFLSHLRQVAEKGTDEERENLEQQLVKYYRTKPETNEYRVGVEQVINNPNFPVTTECINRFTPLVTDIMSGKIGPIKAKEAASNIAFDLIATIWNKYKRVMVLNLQAKVMQIFPEKFALFKSLVMQGIQLIAIEATKFEKFGEWGICYDLTKEIAVNALPPPAFFAAVQAEYANQMEFHAKWNLAATSGCEEEFFTLMDSTKNEDLYKWCSINCTIHLMIWRMMLSLTTGRIHELQYHGSMGACDYLLLTRFRRSRHEAFVHFSDKVNTENLKKFMELCEEEFYKEIHKTHDVETSTWDLVSLDEALPAKRHC